MTYEEYPVLLIRMVRDYLLRLSQIRHSHPVQWPLSVGKPPRQCCLPPPAGRRWNEHPLQPLQRRLEVGGTDKRDATFACSSARELALIMDEKSQISFDVVEFNGSLIETRRFVVFPHSIAAAYFSSCLVVLPGSWGLWWWRWCWPQICRATSSRWRPWRTSYNSLRGQFHLRSLTIKGSLPFGPSVLWLFAAFSRHKKLQEIAFCFHVNSKIMHDAVGEYRRVGIQAPQAQTQDSWVSGWICSQVLIQTLNIQEHKRNVCWHATKTKTISLLYKLLYINYIKTRISF